MCTESSITALENVLAEYHNSAEQNNYLHKLFTNKTNDYPALKLHRDYIEQNKLGFGDRAFHYMWYLLLDYRSNERKKLLEIGVFKGQVISLWALIAKELKINIDIDAVSPLEGNYRVPKNRLQFYLTRLNPTNRRLAKDGNLYEKIDYYNTIEKLFEHLDLNISQVNFFKGYSTDQEILSSLARESYDVIYIDGDHSFKGVTQDINNFAGKVNVGGFLVMDDASCNMPGDTFWKGHQSVSNAVEIIPDLGFRNVLNIGHNRIYQKL